MRLDEEATYDPAKVTDFLKEEDKRIVLPADGEMIISPSTTSDYWRVQSLVEPAAKLWIAVKRSGDFAISLGIPARPRVVFCRWDRRPHARPFLDAETLRLENGPHKHYDEYGVNAPQRIVLRGEDHIPTVSVNSAVRAFCVECNIVPPQKVTFIVPRIIGEFP